MRIVCEKEFDDILNECKLLVINDIKESGLCEYWDGRETNVTAEEHFNNIVKWCIDHINNRTWSDKKSSMINYVTSYGAKHECERDLKCYVANNWMKLAMIFAGLEVNTIDKNFFYKSRVYINEILTNKINFIFRRKFNGKWPDLSIKYGCLNTYIGGKLKIN